jgi:NhaA family Na+:H+ antiporter
MILKIIKEETAAAFLLLMATVFAFMWSNSPWADNYHYWIAALSLKHIVNEGLMTLFFLLIGLGIRQECLYGVLNTRQKALLPGMAALGGMLVPIGIYLGFTWHHPIAIRGFAIPCATDIAFSLGVIKLLGNRVHAHSKIFLSSLAIFDDLLAIALIACFYSRPGYSYYWFILLGTLIILLYLHKHRKNQSVWLYLFTGTVLWWSLLKLGLHPSLAGVVLAFTLPLKNHSEKNSLAKKIENYLGPWVPMLVLPSFAFVNAGVSLHQFSTQAIDLPLFLGIILGLCAGKPLGVLIFTRLAERFGLGERPAGLNQRELIGLSLLCGIGFSISLFVGNLAFNPWPNALETSKLAILMASGISGVLGYGYFLSFRKWR